MSIVSLDGVIAGAQPGWAFSKAVSPTLVAGCPNSSWYRGGFPAAGSAPSNSTAHGAALSSSSAQVAGQLPHFDPGAGKKSYLAQLMGQATGTAGMLMLCDRLLHVGANDAGGAISTTLTSVQAITSATLPARDNNGATTGTGVLCGLECAANMGASTSTSETLIYTDSILGASQTVTAYDAVVSSALAGTFYRFPLAAGGGGVASTQSLQHQATMTSGTLALVLYRVLAQVFISAAGAAAQIDALTSGFPTIYNGVVPFFIYVPTAAAAATISGFYQETQG
jgi:hypothetical protein